jgi:GNAT superfamily N-acetyltransferase
VQIRPARAHELEAARQLLAVNGWGHRAADPERFRQLVARSQVAMVVVDEALRGQGIGAALVHACIGDDPAITWVLRAGRPGVAAFYEKLGFRVSQAAMERPRRE